MGWLYRSRKRCGSLGITAPVPTSLLGALGFWSIDNNKKPRLSPRLVETIGSYSE
jgi:hypothetical protein